MVIYILGLRRSGTTAFWQTCCQDERFMGFNEPFNPVLRRVGDDAWVRSHTDYRQFRALYDQDPAVFWDRYAPIDRHGELQDGLSDKQRAYLDWLVAQNEHVVMDITRAHFKLESLHAANPDALLVHLYRPPANWVTSIVLPSTGHLALRSPGRHLAHRVRFDLRRIRDERTFWSKTSSYDFKGFEDLVGSGPGSAFGVRLREAGIDPDDVYAMPTVGKLLAFWKLHYDHLEHQGRALFGDRFVSVNFNDFCREPGAVLASLYAQAGLDSPIFDVAGIRPPPPPFAREDPRWAAYAERLQLPSLR